MMADPSPYLCALLCLCVVTGGNIPPPPRDTLVSVNKCCERSELMVDGRCRHAEEYNSTTAWSPIFSDAQGHDNVQVKGFQLLIGVPKCYSRQQFPIYHIPGEADRLALLPNGHLRHYYLQNGGEEKGTDLWEREISPDQRFFDYPQGLYCLDKVLQVGDLVGKQFAIVCNPHVPSPWHDTEVLLRRIIDPICHGIALSCYVAVAVIHFVLPQLRDLVGNMITTMCVCLAVSQVADVVRIFTEFTSPSVYLMADAVLYASLLGAFFWLNSAGYYIWKTFRSRNVFLRITDGRKYCYYSLYVWSCTVGMTIFAIFAHLTLDASADAAQVLDKNTPQSPDGAIGWLGVAVFFTPIACTILMDIFFYVSTVNIIKRMSTYGRIHHKMKYSFVTFGKLLLVLTMGWIFLFLAWTPQSGLYYSYIVSNALQGPLVLYICVCGQKRVRFLLRKACCYESCVFACCRPKENEVPEWGEECMAMNTR